MPSPSRQLTVSQTFWHSGIQIPMPLLSHIYTHAMMRRMKEKHTDVVTSRSWRGRSWHGWSCVLLHEWIFTSNEKVLEFTIVHQSRLRICNELCDKFFLKKSSLHPRTTTKVQFLTFNNKTAGWQGPSNCQNWINLEMVSKVVLYFS